MPWAWACVVLLLSRWCVLPAQWVWVGVVVGQAVRPCSRCAVCIARTDLWELGRADGFGAVVGLGVGRDIVADVAVAGAERCSGGMY